jgi:tRNA(adenine34) deaminase
MAVALEQARLAGERGEVPVGAVVVVVAEEASAQHQQPLGTAAGNQAERQGDPTAHAEMLALRSALASVSARGDSWRAVMPRATLYVTCEPCPMCAGAALACRVGRVVYGARQPRVGADGSWASLLRRGRDGSDGGGGSAATTEEDQQEHPYHPNLEVRSGVLADESAALLKAFFRRRRNGSTQAG